VYAVVRSGGKQYRVEEGRQVKLDRLAGEIGATVELGDVLLLGEGADVTVGVPTIAGARVLGTIAEQGRTRKIVVFRYKAKTRSRKKTGHRQHFTRIVIEDILAPGQQPKPKDWKAPDAEEDASKGKRPRRRKASEIAAEEEAAAMKAAESRLLAAAEAAGTEDASADVAAPEDEPEASAGDAPSDETATEKPKRRSRKKEE
jgi:large subunit ribosomal protein L21